MRKLPIGLFLATITAMLGLNAVAANATTVYGSACIFENANFAPSVGQLCVNVTRLNGTTYDKTLAGFSWADGKTVNNSTSSWKLTIENSAATNCNVTFFDGTNYTGGYDYEETGFFGDVNDSNLNNNYFNN